MALSDARRVNRRDISAKIISTAIELPPVVGKITFWTVPGFLMDNQPSRAREFYETITSLPDDSERAAFLRSLVKTSPPTFETEYLDFKCEPQNEKNTKEIWSKSLGGFANTEGGVIVWGVDARPDSTSGVDAASDVKPLVNPVAFRTRLKDFQRDAIDPPISGVEITPIVESKGEGFVVCLIPEGEFKPYRSERCDRQYYHRVNDSFHVINRSMLASLFHPRGKARLNVEAVGSWRSAELSIHTTETALFTLNVSILNDGNESAKDAVLYVRVSPKLPSAFRPDLNQEQRLWKFLGAYDEVHIFEAQRPIHLVMPSSACILNWKMRPPKTMTTPDAPLRLTFEIASENIKPFKSIIILDCENWESNKNQTFRSWNLEDGSRGNGVEC